MIIDVNDSSIEDVVEADICIVGSGAAGITLAHTLIDSGLNVLVVESGGNLPDSETSDLYKLAENENLDANVTGTKVDPNGFCRLRYFGGTTNHWSGWCRPLDEIDFESRSWIPESGWPINKSDLDPYYEAAKPYCDLIEPIFTTADGEFSDLPDYSDTKLKSIFWSFSTPTRFASKYRSDLESADNTTVLLNANVVEIVTNAAETAVNALSVRSLQGKEVSVTASQFVLATGALENTRLLLASNNINPAGVGNQSGMVGKNYQNHPHLDVGTLVSTDPEAWSKLYERVGSQAHAGNGFRLGIAATDEVQKEREILNFAATFQQINADSALRTLWLDIKQFNWPTDFGTKVKMVIEDLIGREVRVNHQVYMYTEQAPNQDSRIILTDELDALGMPRIRMDWKLNKLDKHTVKQASLAVGEEVGRLGVGRLNLRDWVLDDNAEFPESLWGGCHQIGTTRMSESPDNGVVDLNSRVHGIENLFIAGSSVFPTGGHTPPTFTIVALALRLADHLKYQSNVGEITG